MIKLTEHFKTLLKNTLIERYNINFYKIRNVKSISDTGVVIFCLHCSFENLKFFLYLHITNPNDIVSGKRKEITFSLLGDGLNRKIYDNLLSDSLDSSITMFKNLGHDIDLFSIKTEAVSFLNGIGSFNDNVFCVKTFHSKLQFDNEIYASSNTFHSQVHLCNFIISGQCFELSNTSIPLILAHNVDETSSLAIVEDIFKFYILFLKEQYNFLDDVSLSEIKTASIDELKDMINVFMMENI